MRYAGRAICGFIFLTTVTVSSQHAAGAEVRWENDPQAALQRSAATGRPVLMKFTADWCGHCKRMEKTTFADPDMVATVHDNFIPLLIDADQHKDLARELKVTGLPALLIVAPDLTIVERIRGYQTAERLMPRLNTVLTTHRFAASVPAMPAAQQAPANQPSEPNPFRAEPGAYADPPTVPAAEPNPFAAEPNPFEQQTATEPAQVPTPASVPMPSSRYANSFGTASGRIAARPVSFSGLCLTSVVEKRALIKGTPEFSADYRGQTLHFQDAAQRDRFFQSPDKYWPVLDGFCALTLLETGQQVAGELQYAAVFRDQIWVFQSRELMQRFITSPGEYVQQVEERQKLAKSPNRSY